MIVEKADTVLIIFTCDVHPHSMRSYHSKYASCIPTKTSPQLTMNSTHSHGSSTTLLNPLHSLQGFARQCRAGSASCHPAGNITGSRLGWILTGQLEEAANCRFCPACWVRGMAVRANLTTERNNKPRLLLRTPSDIFYRTNLV